ncbi:hypothetical protein KKH18_10215 [bacterium]|nr:hypothetical protein [bacterium]
MPKKLSIKKSAEKFCNRSDELLEFITAFQPSKNPHVYMLYDLAIIKLCASFENFVERVIVGGINNDTSVFANATGIKLPKHLSDEVCFYLVEGGRYFDFRDFGDLVGKMRNQYLGKEHFSVKALESKTSFKITINRLFALRNLAAHESDQSRRCAQKALGKSYKPMPGVWIAGPKRFDSLVAELKEIAETIAKNAPY